MQQEITDTPPFPVPRKSVTLRESCEFLVTLRSHFLLLLIPIFSPTPFPSQTWKPVFSPGTLQITYKTFVNVTDFAKGLEEVWGFSYHWLSNDLHLDATLGSLFFKKTHLVARPTAVFLSFNFVPVCLPPPSPCSPLFPKVPAYHRLQV